VSKSYKDLGEISVEEADEANIPVDIWLDKVDEEAREENPELLTWELHANNYMPRKGRLSGEQAYRLTSDDRAVLVALVKKHWLPLYKTAVAKLEAFDKPDAEGVSELYYWIG
jgi:hypothetical protein